MPPEVWTALLTLVGPPGVGALVGALVASIFVRAYLLRYLEERAKVAATKKDIEELKTITRELKGVEHEYDKNLEETRLRHQLKLAALDRRLLAHQEAYAICRDLVGVAQGVPNPANPDLLAKFQEWWSKNCLYLTADASEALYKAYLLAPRFKWIERNQSEIEAAAAWEKVIGAEDIIAKAAGTILGTETRLDRSDNSDA